MNEENNYIESRYPSKRLCVFARNGMAITGNALASSAGIRILQEGGNAIDAAIAMASTLCVVEPTANGLGSDNFALIWREGRLHGMNSSGKSPGLLSQEAIQAKHGPIQTMPVSGWTPVTVPGAVAGWVAMSERFGRLPFAQVLAPAIEYAKDGYPIGAQTARMWNLALAKARRDWRNDAQYDGYFETFGYEVKAGQWVKLPSIALALEAIAQTRGAAFYTGTLAKRLEEESVRHGGFLRASDLAAHETLWVDPLSVRYRGYDVWELPPNGQGITALMALNTLRSFSCATWDADAIHLHIEAIKQAFVHSKAYVSDPLAMKVQTDDLLSEAFGKRCAGQIKPETAQSFGVSDPAHSGTVYLCAADREGNMVSMIQSNYMGFGSGIVVDGISLQNRGADFSLESGHVNVVAPGKRTYHTIIPGFLSKAGKPVAAFGVMGGYMQPQGHVQVLTNLLDFSMHPQEALDAPRWMWKQGMEVAVEPAFDAKVVAALRAKGHEIVVEPECGVFGRGQILWRLENGVYCGACESRTDSNIGCY